MTRLARKQWVIDLLVGVMIVSAMLGLIMFPKETSSAAKEGIYLCIDVIIPSLFPFFVLSGLVIELGLSGYLGKALEGIMRPLFRLSGQCSAAVVLGLLGGYPVGAKTAIALYEKKLCSREEAERLLAFCNNSGPAFILGAAGAGILGSSSAGWLLFLAHTTASLTIGILFRFYKPKMNPPKSFYRLSGQVVRFSRAFTDTVRSSFRSVFYISAFVIFFTVIIKLLYISGALPAASDLLAELLSPLGVSADSIRNILTGLIEITSGLWSLQDSPSSKLAGQMAMAAFMLGWAGLSVHCQVLVFIGQSGLTPWTYIIGKLLHGIISAVYALLLSKLFNMQTPASTIIAEQVETIARLRFADIITFTLLSFGVFLLGVIITACLYALKRRQIRRP